MGTLTDTLGNYLVHGDPVLFSTAHGLKEGKVVRETPKGFTVEYIRKSWTGDIKRVYPNGDLRRNPKFVPVHGTGSYEMIAEQMWIRPNELAKIVEV